MIKKITQNVWNFLLAVGQSRYEYYKKNPVAYY
jgi:hypothetical protein